MSLHCCSADFNVKIDNDTNIVLLRVTEQTLRYFHWEKINIISVNDWDLKWYETFDNYLIALCSAIV